MARDNDPKVQPRLRRDGTFRTPQSDLERRRRFLRLAAGAGFLGFAGNGLASALQKGGQGSGGNQGQTTVCTTTETYTSSTSSSSTYPSKASSSWSGTEPCWDTPGGGTTWASPLSSTLEGDFYGEQNNSSTYSGSVTRSWGQPGSRSVTESDCINHVRSFTYSSGSYSSFASRYTKTESGTRTATCDDEDNAFRPPRESESKPFVGFPPTLDSEHDVLEFPASVAKERERHLRVFGTYPENP